LKRCINKECCKQCRYFKMKGTMTNWPVQKLTLRTTQKHAQQHDATDIKKTYFLFFRFLFFCFIFYLLFLKWIIPILNTKTERRPSHHFSVMFYDIVFTYRHPGAQPEKTNVIIWKLHKMGNVYKIIKKLDQQLFPPKRNYQTIHQLFAGGCLPYLLPIPTLHLWSNRTLLETMINGILILTIRSYETNHLFALPEDSCQLQLVISRKPISKTYNNEMVMLDKCIYCAEDNYL